jgi:predicted kinase
MEGETRLMVLGGFPGTGKSTVAGRLADDLGVPLLASDLMGNTIKEVLAEHAPATVPGSVAFRAGYAVLFALAEEFASHGSSAVLDINLGWAFQWEALDAIRTRRPELRILPFILECSRATSSSRLQQRHREDPHRYPPVDEFMRQPQLEAVARLLRDIDRPDAHRIDAERPVADILGDLRATVAASAQGAC